MRHVPRVLISRIEDPREEGALCGIHVSVTYAVGIPLPPNLGDEDGLLGSDIGSHAYKKRRLR